MMAWLSTAGKSNPAWLAPSGKRPAAGWRAALGGGLLAGLLAASAGAAAQAADSAPPKAATCVACHGPGGAKPLQPDYPTLAGQTSRYLYLQLKDFKEGRRKNELMTPIVAELSRDEMHALADYFSKQELLTTAFKPDPEKARLGKLKAEENLCTMCHLGGFLGQNEIPRLAGQNHEYIVKSLSDFKSRARTNDAGSMTSVASTLSKEDIENLAHYIAGL